MDSANRNFFIFARSITYMWREEKKTTNSSSCKMFESLNKFFWWLDVVIEGEVLQSYQVLSSRWFWVLEIHLLGSSTWSSHRAERESPLAQQAIVEALWWQFQELNNSKVLESYLYVSILNSDKIFNNF